MDASLPIGLMLVLVWVAPAQAYIRPDLGFSIDPPEGWQLAQDAYVLALFMGPGQGFPPRLSINVYDLPRTSLDDLVTQVKANYVAVLNDFSVLSETEETVLELQARSIVCSWRQGKHSAKMSELLVQSINRFYDLGYIAALEDYDSYLGLFDSSLNTFAVFDSTYSDAELGIELTYPAGWALDRVSIEGAAIFYGPERDGFLQNVVLGHEACNDSLSGYVQSQKSELGEILTDLKFLREGERDLPLGRCYDMVYTYSMPGPRTIKAEAIMAVAGEKAYCMAYTALEPFFDAYLRDFERMVGSLAIAEFSLLPAFLAIAALISVRQI